MPKISELPADNAPDPLDIVPYTDVSASTTDRSTWAGVAASAAFSGLYQPLAGDAIWVPANDTTKLFGTPVMSTINDHPVLLLDATTLEGASATVGVPSWWSTLHVDVVLSSPIGTGAGDVRLEVVRRSFTDGGTLDFAGGGSATIAAPAATVVKVSRLSPVLTVAGPFVLIAVFRQGANAADTLANDVGILGFTLVRAS